jgi:ABC-type polysaccharide/polyol phosphate export permease
VRYLGISVDYLLFLSLGVAMSFATNSVLNDTEFFTRRTPLLMLKAVHPLVVPLSAILSSLLRDLVYFAVFATALHVFFAVDPGTVISSLLLTYTFGLPLLMSIGLLYGSLGLAVRGMDFISLRRLLSRALWIFIPVYYSFEVFPFREWALLVPTVALVEGVRRSALGLGGAPLLVYAFLAGAVLLALSYTVFRAAFEWSRRTGRVLLD